MLNDLEARARRMLAERIATSGRYATVASDAFQAGDRDIFILASDAIGLAVDLARGERLPIEQLSRLRDACQLRAKTASDREWTELLAAALDVSIAGDRLLPDPHTMDRAGMMQEVEQIAENANCSGEE